jgi:hypothetical protein
MLRGFRKGVAASFYEFQAFVRKANRLSVLWPQGVELLRR